MDLGLKGKLNFERKNQEKETTIEKHGQRQYQWGIKEYTALSRHSISCFAILTQLTVFFTYQTY